ncbi:tetratricopeptide repeat protein 25-like [Octopus sinensis]|uniref:Outer dynein arm-docking complex subunit 4 n=1 Tax=Octopus sinensis TaxID=2607531 RepID=A0A7E6FE90_9MOLL|nr:tetratricopeptide repeat protein 25-like [Octopus sinensis]
MKKTESKEQKLGPQCYRNYMTLAVRLYLEKKYTQAIHFFGEALELSPGNKHCLVARSKCYLKEGRPDKALKDTELALQSDSAFPDAVLQKAEAYFQQSNFEAALVHFHRGVQFQVKQEMFIKGVYKCEEAILNAVRWLDKVKKKIGEETTDEERTDTKKSEDKNMTSVFVFENDSTLPSEDKMWILLAELYEDKKFLQKVLRKIDCRREHGWLSKLVVINQIVYFNNQSKFLLAKMPVIERLKQGARSKLGDDLQEINRIYKAKKFRECIDKCVNILNTYSTKELGSKQRHLAEVYSLIGACYLEKKMMEEARIIYINLLAIGDLLDDSEITLNAVSGLIVTYSDDKEYKIFVDVGETDNVGISELQEMWFNYRLGFMYLGVNNETAKKYINMCLQCAETGMNHYYITHSYVMLACANVRTKNFKEALKDIENCYNFFKEETTDDLEALENVLDKLKIIVKEEIACEEEERLLREAREKEVAERLRKEAEEAAATEEAARVAAAEAAARVKREHHQ